jgi:hypothetical protein
MVHERTALTVQGGYYVATGVAPFVSRRAFEAVTGPKKEWWLVQTVGAIVTAVGAALVSGARSGRVTPELRLLAAGSAASLAAIDVVYVARRRIAPTYLLDAGAQLAALAPLATSMRPRHDGQGDPCTRLRPPPAAEQPPPRPGRW